MFPYMIRRELGVDPPRLFRLAEENRCLHSLALAEHKLFSSKHDAPVRALDLDLAERRYLLSGAADATVSIFDVSATIKHSKITFKPIAHVTSDDLPELSKAVVALQWYSEDTGMFFALCADGKFFVLDTNTLQVIKKVPLGKRGHSLHMSPIATSPYLVALGTSEERIPLLDLRTGSALWSLGGHKDEVISVKWSPTNPFLLVSGAGDATMRLWDIRKPGSCLRLFDQYHTAERDFTEEAAEPPMKRFKNQDPNKNLMQRAHDGPVNSVAFTPNGLHIISAGSDDKLRVWDVEKGHNEMVNFSGVGRNSQREQKQFAISNDSNLLFFSNGRKIGAYEIKSGKTLFTLVEDFSSSASLFFHPLFPELYSGLNDGGITVWNADHLDGPIGKEAVAEEVHGGVESSDWNDSESDNMDFF